MTTSGNDSRRPTRTTITFASDGLTLWSALRRPVNDSRLHPAAVDRLCHQSPMTHKRGAPVL